MATDLNRHLPDTNNPSRTAPRVRTRVIVTLSVALAAGALCYVNHLMPWSRPGDFGQSWFGAREMLAGRSAYAEVGPGLRYDWPWPLYYPATSFIVALPFTILSRLWATVTFSAVSAGLLSWAVTRHDWNKLPMFGSAAFIFAAGSAQWSPLFTAAMMIYPLAAAFCAKPSIALGLLVAAEPPVRRYAVYSGALILAASVLLLPHWPFEWMESIRRAPHIVSPLFRRGGFVILLCLMKWRRADARLLLAMAVVPQTGAWYEALPLFLVPKSRNESLVLATLSCLGFLLYYGRMGGPDDVRINRDVGALVVAFAYLPATIMVLRRPNTSSSLC